MITALFGLIILAIVLGLAIWIIEQIPGVGPFARIIRGVAIAIFLIYLLWLLLGFFTGMHALPPLGK
jgi:hypothetical protein